MDFSLKEKNDIDVGLENLLSKSPNINIVIGLL
jgi:hypothetical protein